MNDANEPGREIEALRERISALTGAILRISASLDVDTVLKEVAEAARGLTGARYAVITTEGDTGELEDVVMSGFTAEEERQVVEWTDNMQMFERLRDLPSPLRMADMRAFVAGGGVFARGGGIKHIPRPPAGGPGRGWACPPTG